MRHLREAWALTKPAGSGRHGPLPPALLVLTVVTGVIDAFSYLFLGHVFVANMTGNVVFIAFAAAGAPGFSLAPSILALISFAVGALVGGRLGHLQPHHRGRLLWRATLIEALLVLGAYGWLQAADRPLGGISRYVLIILLGVAMGTQNAAARRLAVPDLTTTVLTLTITGLSADGRLAGGSDSRAGRRVASTLAMFLGAATGAVAALSVDPAASVLMAGALLTAVTVFGTRLLHASAPWTAPPQ
ncbi:YoaK family protein [Streptomyces sp. TG1A-8]|uniref:YoaK family protein n=1 Tax=Streptomyces sp. TG1A-8 TaxID=3051385 RepID=UPI00265C8BB5|nr:YoaK family protein [Streptomyces sp. TG1A-8]MDO0924990.1 YoaK family protein [Streptomyces sp. TG1A-8]